MRPWRLTMMLWTQTSQSGGKASHELFVHRAVFPSITVKPLAASTARRLVAAEREVEAVEGAPVRRLIEAAPIQAWCVRMRYRSTLATGVGHASWTKNSSSHRGIWDRKTPPVIAYRATATGRFSSDGFPTPEFPDTSATTQSAAVGTDYGIYTCYFSIIWTNIYPGFHHKEHCNAGGN